MPTAGWQKQHVSLSRDAQSLICIYAWDRLCNPIKPLPQQWLKMQAGPQGQAVTLPLGSGISQGISWAELQTSGDGEEPRLPAAWPQPKGRGAVGSKGDRGGDQVSDTLPSQVELGQDCPAGRRAQDSPS